MCKKLFYLVSFVLALGLIGGVARADVIVAENLLVDLRAEDLSYGEGVTTWPNHGSLGDFSANGAPVVEDVDGVKAVTFDGSNWFEGPASVPGIEGGGTRSIEIWVYNGSDFVGEETMVSWSHRGGPDGTNIAFNYGNNGTWGAVGHWGSPDMPWSAPHSPAPAPENWWHLVYTYDGTTVRLYVNGEENTTEDSSLNTHGGTPIRVAAQADGTGAGAETGFNYTGSIAAVRIHDGVLSAADIQNNFRLGRLKASSPVPADGALNLGLWVNLGWTPGGYAFSHDIYLGENFDDVNDGTADTFRGNKTFILTPPTFFVGFSGYPYPDGLVPGTTYYWRIDEVNDLHPDSPWKGDVWSFMVPPKKAYEPNPHDGSKFVDPNAELGWTAGFNAVWHTVYFGDNFDDVNAGADDTNRGQVATASYTPVSPLELDKNYYWRVDEFDLATTHTGDVWSFRTLPVIPISDPNLVGWWKLDVGYGALAVDWSGQNNHGAIMGNAQWAAGYDGGALKLDGTDDYVALPIGSVIGSLTSSTFTTWVDFSNAGGAWQRIFDFGSGTGIYIFFCPRTGTGGPMRLAITIGGNAAGEESLIDTTDTLPTGWHHVAAVVEPGSMQIYLDGVVVVSGPTSVVPSDLGETTNNWLGRSQYSADGYFRGSLDDFRIYDYALSQAEIPKTMRGDTTRAWGPSPANGSTAYIREATPLSWSAGDNAAQHEVYFGTDIDVVADANASDTTGVYRGRQVGTSYTPLEGVEWGGGPYYWRVDEYNTDATISEGRIWSFTVADFIVIEDFEDYNDFEPDTIFDTWMDGWDVDTNGSEVGYAEPDFLAGEHFVETTIVHGGSQSMPYFYDTNFKYSEATYSPTQRNWTEESVGVLSLWFYGDAANAAELMYVALNGGTAVYNDNANASQIEEWTEWTIDLQEEFTGVDLTNVNTIAIGFGDKNNLQAGGTGLVFFDDIRLYRPAPPEPETP